VVDTNVLVSGFLWRGTPGRVIELAGEREVELVTSRALLDELAATLAKKRLTKHVEATGLAAGQMLLAYRRVATVVAARRLQEQVSRDADDDDVLACALAGRADLVISGDDDLLALQRFGNIPIVSVAEAVKAFKSPSTTLPSPPRSARRR
jgi:putative PIN family toxin of toxin-antitoxin system